jgi:hypothetical protein
MREIPIDRIKVVNPLREDLGNIQALARSIEEHGQSPVEIRAIPESSDYELVKGLRVLRACEFLHRTRVTAIVRDVPDPLSAQLADNALHKSYTPSEQVAIARRLIPAEHEAARARQVRGKRQGDEADLGESFPKGTGRVWDRIGAQVGTSGKGLQKAAAVVEAAKRDPGFAYLVDQMDRTGKVDGPYQTIKKIQSGMPVEENDRGHKVPSLVSHDEPTIIWKSKREIGSLAKHLKSALPNLSQDGQDDVLDALASLFCDVALKTAKVRGCTAKATKAKLCAYITAYDYEL